MPSGQENASLHYSSLGLYKATCRNYTT